MLNELPAVVLVDVAVTLKCVAAGVEVDEPTRSATTRLAYGRAAAGDEVIARPAE